MHEIGVPFDIALLDFNFAPLLIRRQICMLGLIHKCCLGLAPVALCNLFSVDTRPRPPITTRLEARRHAHQLFDLCDGSQSCLLSRSMFGLVKLYNVLPASFVACRSVKLFQRKLQDVVKDMCRRGFVDWHVSLFVTLGWWLAT